MHRIGWLLLLLPLISAGCGGDGPDSGAGPGRLVLVSGTVLEGERSLVDFGKVTRGEERRRQVVLRNAGGSPLVLEAPRLIGVFSSDLQAAVTIAPGVEQTVEFAAAPEHDGRVQAVARIDWAGGSIDLLLRAQGVHCGVSIVPTAVDFGTVTAEMRATRSIAIANLGEGLCTIESLQADEPFGVEYQPMTLLPGTTANVPLHFVAPAVGVVSSGQLSLTISGKKYEIPLQGEGGEACIVAEPAAIDFGISSSLCPEFRQQNVTLINRCTVPVTLVGASIHQAVQVFWESSTAARLQPGGKLEVGVYTQAVTSGKHEGTLRYSFAGGQMVAIPLVSEALPLAGIPVQETHLVAQPQPVDVLVVVDDTSAMEPWRLALGDFASSLLEGLDGYDFRVGVTTVSSATAPGCTGAPDGRLLPLGGTAPRFVDADTPDAAAVLAARMEVESCQDPALAAGLATAWRALGELASLADDPAHPEADDGNAGFLRDDSHVMVLFVSAAADHSGETPRFWAERFEALRQSARALPAVQVQSWTLPVWCEPDEAESAYELVAWRLGSGTHGLCHQPLEAPFPPWVAPVPSTYYLAGWPWDLNGDGEITWEADEITVAVDGVALLPRDEAGEPVWSCQVDFSSQIRFFPGHRPRAGSLIGITYLRGCGIASLAGQSPGAR